MICNLCKGMGNLFTVQNRKPRWFTCPSCEGLGGLNPFQPANFPISQSQAKVIAKVETRKKQEKKNAQKQSQEAPQA